MNTFNTAFFHTVIAFLTVMSKQLSKQLQADMQSNMIVLDDQVLEIKKQITGGGTIDLIDATTERIDGICSFDKNRLQTGRAFVFDEICLNYKNDAADGKEGSLTYNAAAPAELQNALLIINQDGREALRMPLIDIHNIETGQKAADEYTTLKCLRHLVDDRPISIQIKFAPGVALPNATKHYIHLRLRGAQTSKKAS